MLSTFGKGNWAGLATVVTLLGGIGWVWDHFPAPPTPEDQPPSSSPKGPLPMPISVPPPDVPAPSPNPIPPTIRQPPALLPLPQTVAPSPPANPLETTVQRYFESQITPDWSKHFPGIRLALKAAPKTTGGGSGVATCNLHAQVIDNGGRDIVFENNFSGKMGIPGGIPSELFEAACNKAVDKIIEIISLKIRL